jgi:protein-disulfide isomerase
MIKNVLLTGTLIAFILMVSGSALSQEDKIVQVAIDTFRANVRLAEGTEIKFVEKKDAPIPDFYSVKLVVMLPDKEMPAIVYVDNKGERVFLGTLFIKGENVTLKEAGPPKPRKIDMGILDAEKSPSLGDKGAKVFIVEFSNFQCPHCMDSWIKLQNLIQKHPKEIRYIFKHLPFQSQGKTFELSEMAAAAQEVSNEAFWVVHDFFFTDEGQSTAMLDREAIKKKIEQLLKGKGFDVGMFQSAFKTGKATKRVYDDMALGNKLRVTATPTKIVNGDLIVGSVPENTLERYLVR